MIHLPSGDAHHLIRACHAPGVDDRQQHLPEDGPMQERTGERHRLAADTALRDPRTLLLPTSFCIVLRATRTSGRVAALFSMQKGPRGMVGNMTYPTAFNNSDSSRRTPLTMTRTTRRGSMQLPAQPRG